MLSRGMPVTPDKAVFRKEIISPGDTEKALTGGKNELQAAASQCMLGNYLI